MSGPDKGSIGSAVAADASLTNWTERGATIPMPARINTGYRDPVRAFEYDGKWFVGVGCGNEEVGAQFCLFEALTDHLMSFIDRGSLYSTNVTYGQARAHRSNQRRLPLRPPPLLTRGRREAPRAQVDHNIVWHPVNTSANSASSSRASNGTVAHTLTEQRPRRARAAVMECPDLFPLGDKWVLIGSLYQTNQWWVGTLAGDPPRFTPERVGIVDYGNGCRVARSEHAGRVSLAGRALHCAAVTRARGSDHASVLWKAMPPLSAVLVSDEGDVPTSL
jgi:hypothetical protein